jgi:hypothetical protein
MVVTLKLRRNNHNGNSFPPTTEKAHHVHSKTKAMVTVFCCHKGVEYVPQGRLLINNFTSVEMSL